MSTNENETLVVKRRSLLKGLITLPVLGAFGFSLWKKKEYEEQLKESKILNLNITHDAPESREIKPLSNKKIKLGIIGYGSRGEYLVRSCGFAHPDYIAKMIEENKENPNNKRYEKFLDQPDFNVEIVALCDVFDVRAEKGLAAAANIDKKDKIDSKNQKAIRYKNYKELLADPNVDAVIIATPDHWHAPMAIDAALAGKHVYLEKPMTNRLDEIYTLSETVKKTGIIFQLGHQGRQEVSYQKAREAVTNGILGKISLVEITTNRNDPNGAWVYDIHPEGNEKTIDWQQFLGNAPQIPFNKEHFFRWRCWWAYATGLAGDLLTHEYDAMNQIMDLGIPKYVTAGGGIYFFKDGRDVPDVLNVSMEFPKKDLSLLYSATLASERNRGKILMGHDANMELSNKVVIYADPKSEKYKQKIKDKVLDPSNPIFTYIPGMEKMDGMATATEQYFASRGLLYTYKNGKMLDTAALHIKEWLDCIRANEQPSCDIEQGFQEAIAAQMANIAYREGKRVEWDEVNQVVVGYESAKNPVTNPVINNTNKVG